MNFLLPANLTAQAARELERACVTGGPDNMPWPTQVRVEPGRLTVRRGVDESGALVAPWQIDGVGVVMGATATLMERDDPYHFQIELARGKVNQLRCQAADWRAGGLQVSPELDERIRDAGTSFARAVTQVPSDKAAAHAHAALALGYQAAEQLVQVYTEQVFQVRHERQPRLETFLGCRLGSSLPQGSAADRLLQACNGVCLPLNWREIEPTESSYVWGPHDALLAWAESNGLTVTAGPLLDFSPGRLPDWLWLWERDLHSLASFMCDYVETVVRRYQGRIKCWQLTGATNYSSVLSLGEDELLWLNVRLAEAARQVDPSLELVIGISQPWGEYMALEDRTHSPFIFADTLIRTNLNLTAVDLELVMGVGPRGSYCRDLLEISRLLDLYALLGLPLQVTLGYPSATTPDSRADPELEVALGHWHGGFSPAIQGDWAQSVAALAACKPYVRAIEWAHYSDAEPHQFPHCGLLDADGRPKPALDRLRELRQKHLR
ncbi:MAG TPA: endo-1,4-beta-xylanase [Gemmataceae bacterium]|nr:endo-1,4-beta-xylanase [Gemmataceae bacterium]